MEPLALSFRLPGTRSGIDECSACLLYTSTWASLGVAALFALHPVNVESVAWAAERKNVLSMLFFLLALYAYDRYARTGRRHLYGMVTIFFALGLMAKPQIVTLPFVLLLWDYWPLRRIGGGTRAASTGPSSEPSSEPGSEPGSPAVSTPRSLVWLVWEKTPLFILAAAASVITVLAQRAGDAVRSTAEVSVAARLENVVVSYARYIGKEMCIRDRLSAVRSARNPSVYALLEYLQPIRGPTYLTCYTDHF